MRFARLKFNNWYTCKLEDPSIIDSKVRTDPKVLRVEQDTRIDFQLEKPEGDPFVLSSATNNERQASGEYEDGRQLWTEDGYWFDAMISEGTKKTGRPDRDNEYWMISNPTPAEGINIYVLDTGIITEHVAFRTGGPDQRRVRNFKDLKNTDTSPFCDEPMVCYPSFQPIMAFFSMRADLVPLFLIARHRWTRHPRCRHRGWRRSRGCTQSNGRQCQGHGQGRIIEQTCGG